MNEHSKHYEKVRAYYESNLWSIERVKQAVVKGWITPSEFTLITNQPYEE